MTIVISIAALLIAITALVIAIKKTKPTPSTNVVQAKSIELDGFEITVENNELSINPKK